MINWSYTDRNVRLKVPVSISYNDDPEQAMALLEEAGRDTPRVMMDPAPAARLLAFGDNGIELELRVWINDPQQGLVGVRSEVNLRIWRLFKAAGIVIPFPQRDLHLIGPVPKVLQEGEASAQLVVGEVVVRVFAHVDFHHVLGLGQQFQAVWAQMAQVQALAGLAVTLGEAVDGFDCGMVHHVRAAEIDHHFVRIVLAGVKQV